MAQCLAERRKGGETGVAEVRCLEGDAVWRAGREGLYDEQSLAAALVKGGHLTGGRESLDLFYDGKTELLLTSPRVRGMHTHGTGCTLSAAITAWLARGVGLPEAVVRGKDVPLAQARAYLPDFGSKTVAGRADAWLRYELEPGRRNSITGRVVLHRATVESPGLPEPALEVRRAVADLESINLLERRVSLRFFNKKEGREVSRVCAPLDMLTSVAPIWPAPGTPPHIDAARLPSPCPTSSRLELWRERVSEIGRAHV